MVSRAVHVGLALSLAMVAAGCDHRASDGSADDPWTAAPPSPWRATDAARKSETARLAVPHDQHAALEEAITRAQESAEEAREKWAVTGASLRTRWAVKWAAPLAEPEGGVEYLWVQPVNWSPFRIEALLASEPIGDLAAGRIAAGDLVSFPIDELADWVHYVDGNTSPGARREGGFTIDALEAQYGQP